MKLGEIVSLKLNRYASVVSCSVIRVCAGFSEPPPQRTDGFEGSVSTRHTIHPAHIP